MPLDARPTVGLALESAFQQFIPMLRVLNEGRPATPRRPTIVRLAHWDGNIGRARLVADGAGLENRYGETHRGFESHALRTTRNSGNPAELCERTTAGSLNSWSSVPLGLTELHLVSLAATMARP